MPLFPIPQLIGKTFVLKRPTNFYRTNDIITMGDKAKPVSNQLKPGYTFVLHSFLQPTEENNKYGFVTAKRSDFYLLFYGANKSYYALKYSPDLFSASTLIEQGAQTTQQQVQQQQQENKTAFDKISESLKNTFTGLTKTGKILLYGGAAVLAIGYLMEKNKR